MAGKFTHTVIDTGQRPKDTDLDALSKGCPTRTTSKPFDPAAALAEALKLRPVTHIFKTNGRPEMGFLAEEVEKVEPRLATYGQVEPHGEVRDPKDLGKTLTPATDQEIVLNGVDYGYVTALLTLRFRNTSSNIRRSLPETTGKAVQG